MGSGSGWCLARRWGALLGLLGALSGWGCEAQLEEGRAWWVARHRAEAQGRAGVLRGLEVWERGLERAQAVARSEAPGCASLSGWAGEVRVEVEARLEGADGQEEASLREVREVRRGVGGAVGVRWASSFVDVTGRSGSMARDERVVGGWSYTQEEALPFVRRRARRDTGEEVLERGLDGIAAALAAPGARWYSAGDAAGGWKASPGVDGLALGCPVRGEGRGWLHRLGTLLEVESASAWLPAAHPGARRAEVSGVIVDSGGRRIHFIIEEFKVSEEATVEAPPRWVEAGRDRPLRDAQEILGTRLGLEGF